MLLIIVFICICVCTRAHNNFLYYSAPIFRQGSILTESGAHKFDKTSWLGSSKDSFPLPQGLGAPCLGVLESQLGSSDRAGTLLAKPLPVPLIFICSDIFLHYNSKCSAVIPIMNISPGPWLDEEWLLWYKINCHVIKLPIVWENKTMLSENKHQ